MSDPRVQNLARILVRYSIDARRDEAVAISAGPAATPLVTAIYEELLMKGAFPIVRMSPDEISEIFLRCGRPHHFKTVPTYTRALAKSIDKTINIYSQTNTRALSASDPKKQATYAKTMQPISNIMRKKPWVISLFPTLAYAQDAEMSLGDFEDYVYGATFADEDDPVRAWKDLRRSQQRLITRLKGADQIRIVGPGTDISLSVKGRPFVNSDGHANMPSGEIFTSPLESSAEGCIEYDFPVCHAGREVDGIRLVFKKGKVVEASAKKNQAYLLAMLDSDPGARRLGELGIGTNRKIQRFIKNILFDEKIGGTIHLALGRSIPSSEGKNVSAIHWDMIKDLRRDGAIYVDGKLFQKNGVFK